MNRAAHENAVVSHESENLILVDHEDREIGNLDKAGCHDGQGKLHRAFSLFIFNSRGELLLQKRSGQKRLWGGYWSNSCCSHPRQGEDMSEATIRRLHQELGLHCELHFLYKFEYHENFGDQGSEHELCWVYVGRSDEDVTVNRNEVEEWRFVSPEQMDREMNDHSELFTPWFKMEWQQVRERYREILGLN